MKGLKVTLQRHVELTLTANDWNLFSDMPGAEEAAQNINRVFADAVNSGCGPTVVRSLTSIEMDKYTDFGARDTEPLWVLEDLITDTFHAGG